MQIFENFLPESYVKDIENYLSDDNFPWYYRKWTTHPESTKGAVFNSKTQDSPQFGHVMYENNAKTSSYFDLTRHMINVLQQEGKNIIGIYRIKANLMIMESNYPDNFYNVAHIDISKNLIGKNMWTFLYYVNDTDGDTYIFNETVTEVESAAPKEITLMSRITPKKGSGVLFEANRFHASSPPRKNRTRKVINCVLELG